jgi:hypothetical protein
MKDAKVKLTRAIIISGSVALLVAGALSVTVSRSANATANFAQQTGKSCGYCHANPAGGGKLKPAGEKFKANGNKL